MVNLTYFEPCSPVAQGEGENVTPGFLHNTSVTPKFAQRMWSAQHRTPSLPDEKF
jgi:hypothetical protein